MRLLSSFLIFIILFGCAPRRIPSDVVYPSYPSKTLRQYTVKDGDTLWSIAKKYGVSVQRIIEKNRISSPRDLRVGQSLVLPYSTRKLSSRFIWPVEGEIIGFYGENVDNLTNKGINIKADAASDIRAAEGGEVIFSNYLRGWGNTLIMKHPRGFYTIYANLKETLVNESDKIKKGEVIGKIGSDHKGNSILHFEIRKQHLAQDPLAYLR